MALAPQHPIDPRGEPASTGEENSPIPDPDAMRNIGIQIGALLQAAADSAKAITVAAERRATEVSRSAELAAERSGEARLQPPGGAQYDAAS